MTKSTQIYFLILAAIISAAVFFFFGGKPNMEELKKSVAPAASLYPEAKSVSDKLNFIDDASKNTPLSDVADDKWALLYFGYTSCPDVCPIDLSKINQASQLMENSDQLQVVFVSVDPDRDLGNLDNFAKAFNSSFKGLTAKQDELISISKALGVYHEVVQSQKTAQEDHSNHNHSHDDHADDSHKMVANEKPSSSKDAHYDVDHTSSYLLFNPELELVALLTNPHEPAPMAEALDKIIEVLGQD
ncbi:SCO family protein [Candidatus Pseudothioglobus singularis]|uniref:Electron transporter SenC n=1 Tax=Candidatus Pseudothioglobus singularis PS1 TaxID=1125411 RepID=A0A0M4LR19_9GAMM|nr:SCO family protein [Candidatus Pseudothioglobus singularis]ALE02559.1 electron transporter SenC [Candidatus Pseudothioglobus singularis PS1]